MLDRVKAYIPESIMGLLRVLNWKRSTAFYHARAVRHRYLGKSLEIMICDPVAEEWYDKDCPDLEELKALSLHAKIDAKHRVFVLGAHQCVVSLVLARTMSEGGKVVAVEGARFNFDVGKKNKELNDENHLELVHSVIGATDGDAQFVSVGNGYLGRGKSEVTERVPSLSIDTLASRYGDPDFVFMDIEGVEFSAIKNCALLRRCVTTWAIEAHGDDHMAHYGGSNQSLVDLFRRTGYDIFEFDRQGRYLRLDGDAVVTRSRTHLCCKPNVGAGGAARTDGSAGP